MKKITLILVLVLCAYLTEAQTSLLKVSPQLKFPLDSLKSNSLISSLNQFLLVAEASAGSNQWAYQPSFLETKLLLDEIEGIQISKQKEDTAYYQPVLLDISLLDKNQLHIQVAYIGKSAEIRALFELVAHQVNDIYLFESPLLLKTKYWNSMKLENYTFHYQDEFNVEKAKDFIALSKFYDQKIKIEPKETVIYLVDDGLRSQQYFGLPYKLDYNGRGGGITWSVLLEDQNIYLVHNSDFYEFDPHDLWHSRLSQVKSRRNVNHTIDEAIATLYGGSWGFSWKELFIEFKKQIKFDKNTDWLALKEQRIAFVTDGHRNPTNFMINALLVKKIEQEKGFSAVWELLNSKEEAAYFQKLKELTGITKSNYNKRVWKLVYQELESLERT